MLLIQRLLLLLLGLAGTVYPYSKSCKSSNTRRRLQIVADDLNDGMFMAFSRHCADADYKLYFYVDVHLYIAAWPVNVNDDEGLKGGAYCQEKLYFHDGGDSGRSINIETEATTPIAHSKEVMLELLQGGVSNDFKLHNILDAFRASDTIIDFHGSWSLYDVVEKNCAGFVLQMMEYLHLDRDRRFTSHVTHRLYTNKYTITSLRSSETLDNLLHGSILTRNAPDVHLLDLLVTTNTENFQTCALTDDHSQRRQLNRRAPLATSFGNATSSIMSPAIQYLGRYTAERMLQQKTTCTLCADGSPPNLGSSSKAFIPDQGYESCTKAASDAALFSAGSLECTQLQVSGKAHCGCPTFPTRNTNIICELCNHPTDPYNFHHEKTVFESPNRNDLRGGRDLTCFDSMLSYQINEESGECSALQTHLQYHCGCPNAAQPGTCPLCINSGTFPNGDLEVIPGITCSQYQTALDNGFSGIDCTIHRAVAGFHCECPGNEMLRTTGVPLCDPNVYKPLDPDRVVSVFSDLGDESDVLLGLTCGQMEFQTNAFGDGSIDVELLKACCDPITPLVGACTLCANGAEPTVGSDLKAIDNTNKDYDIPCDTLFWVYPNLYTTGDPQCDTATNPESIKCCQQAAPAPAPTPAPCSCFSEVATVHVQGKGFTVMKELQVNDRVLVGNKNHQPIYQSVYSFGHYNQVTPTEYLRIYTGPTKPLEISPGHLLHVQGKDHPIRADSIQAGDMLLQVSPDAATPLSPVTKIDKVTRNGAYMPLTKDGHIVVDGVLASTYVSILDHAPAVITKYRNVVTEDSLLHGWLAPYRMVCLGISTHLCQNDYNEEGIAYWLAIGKYIASVGNDWGSVSQMVGLVVLGFFMAVFVALEALLMFLGTPTGFVSAVLLLGLALKALEKKAVWNLQK